jgi:hypothetical protein
VKFFPVMMKQLLDEELVDEDTFLAWAGDFTRNEYSADQVMLVMMIMSMMRMMMMMMS